MKNVVLYGFMGAGKTAVGEELSRRLGWPFLDTDRMVESRAGKSVARIFDEDGEAVFRALEREAVGEAARVRPAVVACGGGAVLDPHNACALKASGHMVWLRAALDSVLSRAREADRPLLRGDARGRAAVLLEERTPRYRELADVVVDTDGLSVREVAERVLTELLAREVQTVTVALRTGAYPVRVGDGVLPLVGVELSRLGVRRCAVLTHPRLWRLYGAGLAEVLRAGGVEVVPVLVPPGERSKSLGAARKVYAQMAAAELDRACAVVGLGGGVVGDLAGFVAGTYMRGVRLLQLPTTLLAQVDASVGGKAAVNVSVGKAQGPVRNLVGVFWQPQAVVADVATLCTLPLRELRAGLAECVKHGAVRDARLLEWVDRELVNLLRRRTDRLAELVARNVAVKAEVVRQDERETGGLRETLNFGHTVAHALEAATGYRVYLHGEAVAIGMVVEAELGRREGVTEGSVAEALRSVLRRAGLPTRVPPVSAQALVGFMRLDKKNRGGRLRFALVERLGQARTGVEVPEEAVASVLRETGASP
ncbi:MAG: 3-dehydroquinate synthase [Armatimonadota bacterium]|nr:3-dehydroquinate synthase [Armatimonadota bacterium]